MAALLQRLRGREVTMVTGTDEHGEKIALSAAKAGLDPKAHCDAVVQEYKHLWQLVHIAYVHRCCRHSQRAMLLPLAVTCVGSMPL